MSATSLSCGLPDVHTMSDELILQISCNIFLAFKRISMMTSGPHISHYTTALLSVHVWNHDLIGWKNNIDAQKHFHKTTITSTWSLSKTKIPMTKVKAQMPSNLNKKSRTRDNKKANTTVRSVYISEYTTNPITLSISISELILGVKRYLYLAPIYSSNPKCHGHIWLRWIITSQRIGIQLITQVQFVKAGAANNHLTRKLQRGLCKTFTVWITYYCW